MVTGKTQKVHKAIRRQTTVWLAAGLLAWIAIPCHAINFNFPGFGPPQGSPGPGGWQFRPQDPSNARGLPPSSAPPAGPQAGWGDQQGNPWSNPYPGMQPGWGGQQQQYSPYGQRPTQPQIDPPRIEVEIGNLQPYVQENVLLAVRLISTANLETANPELPPSNEVLFQKLQGPTARSRSGPQGRQEIVNEFVYAVTALRPGLIDVPPIRVTGTQSSSGYGRAVPYDVSSQETTRLQVRPAMPSVQPWLPLEELRLTATFDRPEKAEEGQPVTLMLQLDAIGGGGTQLPSLEPQLQAGDFRVYREQTLTDSKLSSDGTRLQGMRAEYFTLVPRSGGKLRLPELRVPWWNVKTGAKEFATLPIKTLQVQGESGPFGLPVGSSLASAGAAGFWLPIAGLALLISGYWAGVWYKGRRSAGKEPLPPGLRAHLDKALIGLGRGASAMFRRIDPRPWIRGAGPWLQTLFPSSLRFWMCVRQADPEPDPAAWAAKLQTLSCRSLKISDRAPLPTMAEHIDRLHPGANSEKLRALLQELDGALYGQKTLDFPRWKQEFKQQVRPRPVSTGLFRLGRWYRRERLPELNPQEG